MGKNKLRKFAEMETFPNVFQCGARNMEYTVETRRWCVSPEELSIPPSGGEGALAMKGNWRTSFFKNDNPIVLELGCGRGEYTVGLAALYPEKNFIGVDIKGARMWAGAKEAVEKNMPNVAFLRTNIEMLPAFFAPNEVDEIWITFPDPQMKKATKRLTSTYFMNRYRQLLKDNGIIHLKTDSPFLFTYTSEMVKLNQLPILTCTDNLYASRDAIHGVSPDSNAVETHQWCVSPVLGLKTHYEKQWLERGLTIKYIQFRLPHTGSLQEPEIDIEYDSYRSYGRNQRPKTNTPKQTNTIPTHHQQ